MNLTLSASCRATAFLCLAALPALAADAPAGLHNFFQVDDHLYRGAQPSREGFSSLAKLGVRTILDLRESGGRAKDEARLVQSLGMSYINVPMNGFQAPSMEQVSRVLQLLEDASKGPLFIHCRRGADRTGTIIAIYRIRHDHWDNHKALAEAETFRMASWERLMRSFVLQYRPSESLAQQSASSASESVSQ